MNVFRRNQTSSWCRRLLAGMVAGLAIVGGSFVDSAERAEAQQAGFVFVDAGRAHTCGLKKTTAVAYCWGANDYGQATPPWGWTFKQIAAGEYMTCGLGGDGVVTCWGAPKYGVQTLVREQWTVAGTFKQIEVGHNDTGCGILTSGALRCWDTWNGLGTTATASHVAARAPSGSFISVAPESNYSCGVRSNFTAVCWGGGALPNVAGAFLQVSRSDDSTCFLTTKRDITCQGDNRFGQAPALVVGPFTSVGLGLEHGCGLRTTGAISCWGLQTHKPGASDSYVPTNFGQTTVPPGTWKQLSVGLGHTCGIRSDDVLVCWGDNGAGQRA